MWKVVFCWAQVLWRSKVQ